LNELWSDRLIEIHISNGPELHFRQGLIHGDLQKLYYYLGDMHTPYPNIKEDMEFTKVHEFKKLIQAYGEIDWGRGA
jgi:hypothetical protein